MKVVLTAAALADLDDIANWIARDSLTRAERFVDRLQQRCASLSRHPQRFPVVTTTDIRKFSYRGYVILYRDADTQVDVLRIVHASRNWVALLDEGDE